MNRDEQDMWREALRATSLGWDLAVPMFGGVLVGYLLDRALGTRYVFTLSFLLLGIGTGFYNVLRSIQRVDERSRARDRRKKEAKEKEGGGRT